MKLLGSQVVCADCEEPVFKCYECGRYACHECMDAGKHPELDPSEKYAIRCNDCHEKEANQYAWMGVAAKQRRESCELMGIPSDSTDAEMMEAARGLK